jgi:hypothetical protein
MTRQQVVLVNAIYLLMCSSALWGCREMSLRAGTFEQEAYNLASGQVGELVSRGEVATAMITAFGLAMAASLKFMWDVRHPNGN